MKRRVVVTGMSALTPLGSDLEQAWGRILQGESGIGPIQSFDASELRTRIAGEVSDFDVSKVMPVREAGRVDRFVQLAVAAAENAVAQSGLDFEKEDLHRCGAIVGNGIGGLHEFEIQYRKVLEKGPNRMSVFTIPKMMINAAAGHISIRYGLKGPSVGVVSACASGSNAIVDAVRSIRCDEVDLVITGGAEGTVTLLGIAGFNAMRALSERNDEPQRASRPFDQHRDGFVLSEGAGILILEELERAKRRGAPILGEILGYGVTCDGTHITQPDPEGAGAARAMSGALTSAGLNPEDIDYINAHGTSTILGDKAETMAIKTAFGNAAANVSISSTKSSIGHLLGGSGGVELVLSLLAMRDNVAPPTINLKKPDLECDLDYTPNAAREMNISRVMSNSFGFGGHNVSIVAGEYRE
jgi:3-oxoacyl-[acyl-carrier-protein] synthase II